MLNKHKSYLENHYYCDIIDSGKNNFETTVKEAFAYQVKETNAQ